MNQKILQTNIAIDFIFQSLSPIEQSRLPELLASSQELRQELSQFLLLLTKEGISQKELDGNMNTVLTELHRHSLTNLALSLPALSRLLIWLLNQNKELNSKQTYKITLTKVSPQQSTSRRQTIQQRKKLTALLRYWRNTPQDSEDLPVTQTVAGEDNQLLLLTMKKLLNIKEWSTKKTTRVEVESAESEEEIRAWVRNNIS